MDPILNEQEGKTDRTYIDLTACVEIVQESRLGPGCSDREGNPKVFVVRIQRTMLRRIWPQLTRAMGKRP